MTRPAGRQALSEAVRPKKTHWVLWAVVLAVAVALRFWQISGQILIDDEWHAVHKLMMSGYKDIFLSLGHADYSIPLTLLFRWLADSVGLTMWKMRFLPLLTGVLAVPLLPRLLGRWLDGRERLLFAALLAVSPLLIHFSRYVRPYSPVILLGFAAVILLWHWWHGGGHWRAVLFSLFTIMAAWLHPLSALFPGAALVWFFAAGLLGWRNRGQIAPLVRLWLLAVVTVGLSCALLLPPILADSASLAVKSGMGRIEWSTVAQGWELIFGTAGNFMGVFMLLPVVAGAVVLWRRDRLFLLYWLWMTAFAVAVIALLAPEWLQNALVLVRYAVIAQPFFLALAALGVLALIRSVRLAVARGLLAAGLVTALFFAGPLPGMYGELNQFTNGLRYQFDYDFVRSPFHPLYNPLPVSEPYEDMKEAPGHWQIIETGWHFEINMTPISEYQRFHQLPIKIGMISGLCTDERLEGHQPDGWTWGELNPDSGLDIALKNFVFLTDVLAEPPAGNRFVVFHRRPFYDWSRTLPDVQPCIDAFRDRFGEPWRSTDDLVVFRILGAG